MARPPRDGIDYFSFDVGMLRDTKLKLIKGEFGALGIVVYIHLLCAIYEDNGYFKEWSDDVCILVSEEVGCGCNFGAVAEIVQGLIRRSLFDERVANTFGVLTSAGIQRRYIRAASHRDDIQIIKEYWLLDTKNKKDVPEGILVKLAFNSIKTRRNPDKTCRNPDKTSNNPYRKVQERKGKESTVLGDSTEPPATEQDQTNNIIIDLILKDGSLYYVTSQMVELWKGLYPKVDIMQELRIMKGWCISNPFKRKTKKGVNDFITGWLAGEQKEKWRNKDVRLSEQPENTELPEIFEPSTGFLNR